MIDAVIAESENIDPSLNNKKALVMVISKKWIMPKYTINVNCIKLRQAPKLKYLHTMITRP